MLLPTNIVGGAGGPRLTVQDLALEIARGNVLGAEPFGGYGRYTSSGSISNKLLWPNGTYVIPNSSGIDVDIVSDNINDTAAGTGAQSIEVHYLDINLNPQHVIIPLTGTTPIVGAVTGVRFIQFMHVHTTGTPYQGAVGNIKAYIGAQTYALIAAGNTLGESSARMVPAGKRAIIVGLVGSSISGTAAAGAQISLRATELDANQYSDSGLFFPYGSVGLQDTSETFNLPIPQIFKEGTVIAMFGTVDKTATMTGSYYGWLEDVA